MYQFLGLTCSCPPRLCLYQTLVGTEGCESWFGGLLCCNIMAGIYQSLGMCVGSIGQMHAKTQGVWCFSCESFHLFYAFFTIGWYIFLHCFVRVWFVFVSVCTEQQNHDV